MALSDLVSAGLQRPIAAIRRHAVSLAIAIVAAAGALIYAASALLMALELAFGPIGARLAVAGVMLAIAVGSYFAPRLFYRADATKSCCRSRDGRAVSRPAHCHGGRGTDARFLDGLSQAG